MPSLLLPLSGRILPVKLLVYCTQCTHRRRIYTEEKAKVVAAVWGTEVIQFLDALAILHYLGRF